MSASTALDGGALHSGIAWRVPGQHFGGSARLVVRSGGERRSPAPVARLTRAHNELCTQAVDRFEIAAGLEAAGVSDRQARRTYGVASVFELAEAMHRLVPQRPLDVGVPTDPWRRPLARHLLRGLLYGLPGLLYVVAARTLHTGFDALVLVGATVVACGLGQGLSLLGHVLLGRGERRAARTLFGSTLLCGGLLLALLLALLVTTGRLSGFLLPAGVLAGCQVEYLLAATVLMVLDADLLLLAVLAPGVLLATAVLTGVAATVSREVVLGVLALCLVGAVTAAGSRLTEGAARRGRRLREVLGRAERSLGAGHVVYGAVNAALLSFAVVDVLTRREDAAGAAIALMMLPLVASLGVAEWLVYRLRNRAAAALHETTSTASFRARAHSQLGLAVLGYGAVLAALTGAVVAWHAVHGRPDPLLVLSTCAYAVLGLAFLLQTLLLSLGRHRLALGLATAALAVDTCLRWPLASHSTVALGATHLSVFAGLLLILLPVTAAQYGSVGVHR
ncbi:MAG: hypothetical protein WAL50_17155 [Kineosporiaceae bacterium]